MEKSEPEKIVNKLSFPVEAFLKIDNQKRRGAGPKPNRDAKHQKRVEAKGELELAFDGKPKSEFVLIIEMDYMPRYEGHRAVKAIPGNHLWPVHHIEYRDFPKKYRINFMALYCTKKMNTGFF